MQEVSKKADKNIEDTGRVIQGSLKKTKAKIVAEQNMTQAKTHVVIEAVTAAITGIRKTDNPVNNVNTVWAALRLGHPAL